VGDAASHPQNSYDITQRYYDQGIRIMVGYEWTSILDLAHDVSLHHNITLISTGSSSLSFAIDDTIFRLTPSAYDYQRALLRTAIGAGVTNVITLGTGYGWDNFTKTEFEKLGGTILSTIHYGPPEIDSSYIGLLKKVNSTLVTYLRTHSNRTTGILLYDDNATAVLRETSKYPSMSNVTWFTLTEATNRTYLNPDVLKQAAKVKLIAPTLDPNYTDVYSELNGGWDSSTLSPISFTQANTYDGLWLACLSVIEANSTESSQIKAALPRVALTYRGIAGSIVFDQYGDRTGIGYDLLGYFMEKGTVRVLSCGYFNGTTGTVAFNESLFLPNEP
jgi:ABC-type branched-subunit amino acid transport system substrate-binding protein